MANIHKLQPYKCARNKFNLGHTFNFTAKFGYVYPVLVQDYVPGDAFSIDLFEIMRMQPLSSPAFIDAKVRFDVFRVDNNIVCPQFLDYIKQMGSEESPLTWPHVKIPSGGFAKGSLGDFLGVSVGSGDGVKMDALPFRGYNKILNDWYINSNIQEETEISTSMGLDTTTPTALRKANLRKDRFTGLQTTTQRGGDVILPVASTAPIVYDTSIHNNQWIKKVDDHTKISTASGKPLFADPNTSPDYYSSLTNDGPTSGTLNAVNIDLNNTHYADLSGVSGVSLNLLNSSQRLNVYRTLSLFAGDRYPEWQYIMWGIPSSDARLQRSEWLGSWKMPFVTSEILQTSETTSTSPQGTMAGHGFSSGGSHCYIPTLNEYGYLFVLMTILPSVSYDQGLPKKYNRESPFDYAMPIFSSLPMQPVKNSELYLQADTVVDSDGNKVNDGTLGYAPIFDEYRYSTNRIAGDFHDTLNYWIVDRKFDSLPVLNSEFIQPASNIGSSLFAVDTDVVDPFIGSIKFNIKALRKLPKVGLPTFI